jgi:hypothetical protein
MRILAEAMNFAREGQLTLRKLNLKSAEVNKPGGLGGTHQRTQDCRFQPFGTRAGRFFLFVTAQTTS